MSATAARSQARHTTAAPTAHAQPEVAQRASLDPARGGSVPFVRLSTLSAAPLTDAPALVQATLARDPGVPLPLPVRSAAEASLAVDLAAVRVHQGAASSSLVDGIGARAFALGSHVFLGGRERSTDVRLMAHEIAHVVQQQGDARIQRKDAGEIPDALEREADHVAAAVAVGRPARVEGRTSARPQFQFGWLRRAAGAVAGVVGDVAGAALNFIRDRARVIPGYDMLALILGRDPLTQQPVERNAVNVIRGVTGLWPGGSLFFDALQRYGIVDRVGAWLEQRLRTVAGVVGGIRDALTRFISSLGPGDVLNLGGVWDRARRIFSEPIDAASRFVRGLVSDVLGFIRDAVLRPLARLAEGTRAYDLLRLVLGSDPITGEPYPRTPANMIGGFMRLIGQEEKWRHLQESGAIPRAWAWFQQQLATLLGFVRQVPGLFVQALRSLQITDLLNLPGTFRRMAGIFGGFISGFLSWAGNAAIQIMMFIFEVLAPGAMPVLRRAATVIRTIVSAPIRFVGNLVRAGLRGFEQFRDNVRTHLINGLVGWLTGALTGAGLQLPQRWDLRGILSLVLQILGLTWQNIRQKLLRHIPEPVLRGLETTFDIVVTLVREGPAAAWQKILEQLQNLQEMVFSQIREWVTRTVVGQAVIRIVSMLNPAGAVIQAIIAIYNTIMFFRERLAQIIQVAEAFFSSIAQIAAGNISAAASRVEQTMARLVPVVISFLARLIGLGGISDTIRNIIARIRAPIDRALDRVVDWIVAQARRLGRAIVSAVRGQDTRTPEEKQRDLDRAVRELTPQLQQMLARGTRRLVLRARMLIWKQQYRLTDLSIANGKVRASINPTAEMFSVEERAIGAALEPILREAERAHLAAIEQRDASGRLAAARVHPNAPFPAEMTQEERVILMRERVRVAEAAHAAGEPLPTAAVGAMGTTRGGRLAPPRTSLRADDRGVRIHVRGGQSYAPAHLPGMPPPPLPDVPREQWPQAYRNMSDRDVNRTRAIWLRSMNIAAEGRGLREGHEVVRDEAEIARGEGNLAAQRLGVGLVGLGIAVGQEIPLATQVPVAGAANVASVHELQFGRMAPMATFSSAGRGTPAEVQQAAEVRRSSYAVILNTLRQAVQQNQDALVRLPAAQVDAMRGVAAAYDRWHAVAWQGNTIRTGSDVDAAAEALRRAITEFLAAMREQ